MKTEAQLETLFRKRVEALGGKAFKIAPTHVGIPDRMVLLPGGRIELVELKTETGKLSAAQIIWHERAYALGTTVTVLYGERDILQWTEDQHEWAETTDWDDKDKAWICIHCGATRP
jgi:hypothetical protein